jgi:nitrite reductase/ring-hydroxylating ferredoxin subunit/uncharacterized membrane protein
MNSTARGLDRAVHYIESQDRLDRFGFKLEHALALGFNLMSGAGRRMRTRLHGTRLGHPLHPVLTDIPIGAWTVTAVLDVADVCRIGRSGLRPGAAASIRIGLAGAGAAVVTGLTDWQFTEGDARRLGLVHAGGNVAVTSLYAMSLRQRRRGRRRTGLALSGTGYALLLVTAYLGGTLSFRHRIGVDHADRELQPREFIAVLPADELRDEPCAVDAGGTRIVLVRHHGIVSAFGDLCPHQGGPMSEGVVVGDEIVCPWHGSRYLLGSGTPTVGPATAPLARFDARIREGQIEVRRRAPVQDAPPGAALKPCLGGEDARD